MKFIARLGALVGAAAFLIAGLSFGPAYAGQKKVIVHAHTRVTKTGKIVHVKAHTRVVKTSTIIHVKAHTRITKTGKVVHVKAHTRMAPSAKKKPMAGMHM